MDNLKTGQLIAQRRKELGWTQRELSEKLNVSDRTVSKWERGAGFPDVSLLEPLADTLELSVLELLNGVRMKEEEVPPAAAEKAARSAVAELGERLRRGIPQYCAAIVILSILLLFTVALSLWRRFGSWPVQDFKEREVSIGEAVAEVPFAVLTWDEFQLAMEITEDPVIRTLAKSAGSSNETIEQDQLAQYLDRLRIEGDPAGFNAGMISGHGIILDYGAGDRRCILEIVWDGSVRKTSSIYTNGFGGNKGPVVQCENNESFRLGWLENRALLG